MANYQKMRQKWDTEYLQKTGLFNRYELKEDTGDFKSWIPKGVVDALVTYHAATHEDVLNGKRKAGFSWIWNRNNIDIVGETFSEFNEAAKNFETHWLFPEKYVK